MGHSFNNFIILLLLTNILYIVYSYMDRYLTKKEWIQKRKQWWQYILERSERIKLNEMYEEHNEKERAKDPIYQLPKIQPMRGKMPKTWRAKMKLHKGTATIKNEENKTELENVINDEIYNSYGAFGDIVELSRQQILEGWVRPKNYRNPNMYDVTPVENLPGTMGDFQNTFDKSSRDRWAGYQYKHPHKPEYLLKEMAVSSGKAWRNLKSKVKRIAKVIAEDEDEVSNTPVSNHLNLHIIEEVTEDNLDQEVAKWVQAPDVSMISHTNLNNVFADKESPRLYGGGVNGTPIWKKESPFFRSPS